MATVVTQPPLALAVKGRGQRQGEWMGESRRRGDEAASYE